MNPFSSVPKIILLLAALCGSLLFLGCGSTAPEAEIVPRVALMPNAMVPGTDPVQFARGQAAFQVTYTPLTGLGPDYNGASCSGCHSLPTLGGQGSKARRVIPDGPTRFVNFVEQDVTGLAYYVPPSLLGLGALQDQPIACGVDPALGIAGHPAFAGKPIKDKPARFGHKLQTTDLRSFTAGAFVHEIGLCVGAVAGPDEGNGCALDEVPNVPDDDVDDVIYFLQHLAAPAPLSPPAGGAELFASTGCATCHAGPLGTDLCLHDMGPTMADVQPTEFAGPSDWRTTPLVYVRGRFAGLCHDGRAGTSVATAITLCHGGEAAGSVARYQALTSTQRNALVGYVNSR